MRWKRSDIVIADLIQTMYRIGFISAKKHNYMQRVVFMRYY